MTVNDVRAVSHAVSMPGLNILVTVIVSGLISLSTSVGGTVCHTLYGAALLMPGNAGAQSQEAKGQ